MSRIKGHRIWAIITLIALLLAVAVPVTVAQTGVGLEEWGLFQRILASDTTSQSAVVTIVQGGTGRAIRIINSAGVETAALTGGGDMELADDLTVSGDLIIGNGTPGTGGGITAGEEDLYVEGGVEIDGSLNVGTDVDILTDLRVGDADPTNAQDGEDAFVEGHFEVDGVAYFDGNIDMGGTDIIIDADADSILQEDADDQVSMTLGAAAGYFSVLTGSFKVGNGVPDVALDGEDAYVEGTLEVDGAVRLDGVLTTGGDIDLNGSDLIIDADADSILQEATDDNVTMTLGAAGGTFQVTTGNLEVGNGAPTVTLDGEDAYVEGTFEVDAIAYFDGGVDMNASMLDLDADNDTSITADTDDQIDIEISAADDFQFTANMFELLVGSDMKMNGGVLDLDADDDTSITASTDDQIDFEVSGADDFQMTANTFTVLAGSMILPENATNTGSVFTAIGNMAHTDIEVATTMFVIPANANIVDVSFSVDTQWNDGASAVMDCGISGGDVDAFVDNHNINDGADYNRLGDAADMPFASALLDVGGSDITVICQVDEGNVDANAGAARIYITYLIWD